MRTQICEMFWKDRLFDYALIVFNQINDNSKIYSAHFCKLQLYEWLRRMVDITDITIATVMLTIPNYELHI